MPDNETLQDDINRTKDAVIYLTREVAGIVLSLKALTSSSKRAKEIDDAAQTIQQRIDVILKRFAQK